MKRLILSTVVMVFAAIPVSAQSLKSICKTAQNSADEIACASHKYDEAKEDLNAAYDALWAHENPAQRSALRVVQQKWAAFKDIQCEWEAGYLASGSLNRMRELECLVRYTREREALLQNLVAEDADVLEDDLSHIQLVEVPRWLNALSEARDGVFWQYAGHLDSDLDCDGAPEHILAGLRFTDDAREKVETVIAVSEDPQVGKPFSQRFNLVSADDGIVCSTPVMLRTIAFEGQSDSDVCTNTVQVESVNCPVFVLSKGDEGYVFEPVESADDQDSQ